MKALKFYIVFVLLGILLSCAKKKYPEPEVVENEAVFYSQLTIDNKPMVLKAGVDGYYMFSSYKLDSNFVYGFIADLKNPQCSNCNSLKIQINDFKVSIGGESPEINTSLQPSEYPLLNGNPVETYSVGFVASNFEAESYTWDFGDGTISHENNPNHPFPRAGNYNVCLTMSKNSCVSTICNIEKINTSPNSCKTSITGSSIGNTVNFISTTIHGKGPYNHLWNFGDGTTATTPTASCTYKYSGAYAVSLRVVDQYGDTAYAKYNAKTANDSSSCAANYTKTDITRIPANAALSQIIITWVAADGTVYTSNNASQPDDSSFEILSVSDNGMNENSQLTKKIRAKFKCKLYNGKKSVTVNDADVIICVAYK